MLGFVGRDVIFSLRPHYAENIVSGAKTVELRRRFAGEAVIGSTAFLYACAPVKAIIGYAEIADVRRLTLEDIWSQYGESACIRRCDFDKYFDGLKCGYAIVLQNAKRLRTMAQAHDLRERFGFRAPQSYSYASQAYGSLIA